MNLRQCYQILDLPIDASVETVTATYRRLAQAYHPDKNRDRVEWANGEMSLLNQAYDTILSHRFKATQPEPEEPPPPTPGENKKTEPPRQKKQSAPGKEAIHPEQEILHENLVRSFIRHRENVKDAIYRFFQYNLSNLARREKGANAVIYKRIVIDLRKAYHGIKALSSKTDDRELLEHFSVFMNMVFNFYRSAECLNVIDSYKSQYEVNAYRTYHHGDEALLRGQKEIFYDRHNRGFFRQDEAVALLMEAAQYLKSTVKYFPQSTWNVEAEIKYACTRSLLDYLTLFFSEE